MGSSVLVVDDDSELREMLCDMFETLGYRAAGVNDGRQALDYLEGNPPPSVILLDLLLPGMSGWEFLEFLRADTRLTKVPVVVLSAVSNQNVVALRGVTCRMHKPVSLDKVLAAVKAHCDDPS